MSRAELAEGSRRCGLEAGPVPRAAGVSQGHPGGLENSGLQGERGGAARDGTCHRASKRVTRPMSGSVSRGSGTPLRSK